VSRSHGRRIPVDLAQVVIEESDVSAGDLESRRAVAEDPLETEYVAAVLEERAGKTFVAGCELKSGL
jgi:hypothetical protein